jgi:hypothetical protein
VRPGGGFLFPNFGCNRLNALHQFLSYLAYPVLDRQRDSFLAFNPLFSKFQTTPLLFERQ